MADYVEEREFTLRLQVRCTFPADYEGDEDGYQWAAHLPGLTAEVVQAALKALKSHSEWAIRPANRGRSAEDEVTLVLERVMQD